MVHLANTVYQKYHYLVLRDALHYCTLRGTQLPTCSEVLPTCREVLPTCREVLPTCREVLPGDNDSTESNCYGFESSEVIMSIHIYSTGTNELQWYSVSIVKVFVKYKICFVPDELWLKCCATAILLYLCYYAAH